MYLCSLKQRYQWVDGTPLVYHNLLLNKKALELAIMQTIKVDTLKEETINEDYRQIPYKKYKEQLYRESTRQYFVPYNTSNQSCIVISTNIRTLGMWVRVDCNEVFDSVLLICEHLHHYFVGNTILRRQPIECHSCK